MLTLPLTLEARHKSDLDKVFLAEIMTLDKFQLPLQQALRHSSCVSDEPISPIFVNYSIDPEFLNIKVSIFYTGIIAGCNCADDPSPIDLQNEYCELDVRIDKQTAQVEFILTDEYWG